MRWRKLGLVFCPDGSEQWMKSHAANPVVEKLAENRLRVYFSCRDSMNRSQIASIEMELRDSQCFVSEESVRCVLKHGKNGRFDDSGVTVAAIVRNGPQRLLYYLGWNLGVTIPFRNAIGVAVSRGDEQTFVRVSEGPLVDRDHFDPISLSYPFLLYDESRFRIWYGSCVEWTGATVADYQFSVKYAESEDGLRWRRNGEIAVACDFPREDAIARPHVIRDVDRFRMWYSRKRGRCYRMGYAESTDGRKWIRMDDIVGIDVSADGWDSEMIEYPFVFDHLGERYMLYNGNGYGQTGFGMAVLADS